MKKLVLMVMLFLAAQCGANPWDGSLTSHNVWTDGDNNFWIIGDDDAEQEDNDANQEEVDWADTLDPEFGVPRRMLFPAGMEDAYIQ